MFSVFYLLWMARQCAFYVLKCILQWPRERRFIEDVKIKMYCLFKPDYWYRMTNRRLCFNVIYIIIHLTVEVSLKHVIRVLQKSLTIVFANVFVGKLIMYDTRFLYNNARKRDGTMISTFHFIIIIFFFTKMFIY